MDRRARMAATPARRVRFLLSGVLALAVLTGGSLYLARSELFAGPASEQGNRESAGHRGRMQCGGRQCLPREPGLSRRRRAAGGGNGLAAPGQDVAFGVRILPLAVAAPDHTRRRLCEPARRPARPRLRAAPPPRRCSR